MRNEALWINMEEYKWANRDVSNSPDDAQYELMFDSELYFWLVQSRKLGFKRSHMDANLSILVRHATYRICKTFDMKVKKLAI